MRALWRLGAPLGVQFTLEVPSLGERATLWQRNVPALTDGDAETLASRFAAPGGVIASGAAAKPRNAHGSNNPQATTATNAPNMHAKYNMRARAAPMRTA